MTIYISFAIVTFGQTQSFAIFPSAAELECHHPVESFFFRVDGYGNVKELKGFLISRINQLSVRKGFCVLVTMILWWLMAPRSGGLWSLNNGDFFNLLKPDKLWVQQWWMTFKSSPVASRTVHNPSRDRRNLSAVWWTVKCAHDAVLIGSQCDAIGHSGMATTLKCCACCALRRLFNLNAFKLVNEVSCLMRAKENPFDDRWVNCRVSFPFTHFPLLPKFSFPI